MRRSICLGLLIVAGCGADDVVLGTVEAPPDTSELDTDPGPTGDIEDGEDRVPPSSELLANPGFERGETWWTQADGVLNHDWSRTGDPIYDSSDTFTALEGVAAYKVWGRYADTVPNDSEHGLDIADLTAGDTLSWSVQAFTHADDPLSDDNGLVPFVRFYSGDGSEHSVVVGDLRVNATSATGEWHSLSMTATVPEGVSSGQVGVRFTLSDWSATGSVYLDSASLSSSGTGEVSGERLMVWHDEFDGPTIDSASWTHEILPPYTYNNELQAYTSTDENARIEDGQLLITALAEGSSYTSARLNTSGKAGWRYGRIEGALRVPAGVGTWPALWMLPTDWVYGGWPNSGEIDIMEHVGCDVGIVVGTVHTGAYNHLLGTQKGQNISLPDATTTMHVYAIDWTPNRINFLVNGHHYFTFENDGTGDSASWPFDQVFHLVVNLAVGGDWGGYCGVDRGAFPQTYSVDWMRVYQTTEEAGD